MGRRTLLFRQSNCAPPRKTCAEFLLSLSVSLCLARSLSLSIYLSPSLLLQSPCLSCPTLSLSLTLSSPSLRSLSLSCPTVAFSLSLSRSVYPFLLLISLSS